MRITTNNCGKNIVNICERQWQNCEKIMQEFWEK